MSTKLTQVNKGAWEIMHATLNPSSPEAAAANWSEALIIVGIHEYRRYIHEYPWCFMKFEDFMNGLGVSSNFFKNLNAEKIKHFPAM
jgi:hypothetical protein